MVLLQTCKRQLKVYNDSLVQGCSAYNALAMALLKSRTKPSTFIVENTCFHCYLYPLHIRMVLNVFAFRIGVFTGPTFAKKPKI